MILKNTIKEVALSQRDELEKKETGVKRELLNQLKSSLKIPHALIISGIRRCGKSTLLKQLTKEVNNFYYFNFEDQRALGFEVGDFEKLDEVFHELYGKSSHYFLDEIQNIPGWERFVRRMQDTGKRFVITGSNASLLSKEPGTKLTGRHITKELFPFSYREMLELEGKKPSLLSFGEYLGNGGFPEYLKYKKNEILQELLRDILLRDIVVRYSLRDSKLIQTLAEYLITNSGNEFSYNKLKEYFSLGSVNSVISYVHYLQESYLMFAIPRFDYSAKKMIISPKKIYSIDCGLSAANSASFSGDKGRVFENLVFLSLRRKYKELFYFKGKGECDFLVKEDGRISRVIQACYKLEEDNKERELSGLREAMQKFNLRKGQIVTMEQEDKLGDAEVVAGWRWCLD